MKIRNIFFIALASTALIACGSKEKSKAVAQPLLPPTEQTQQELLQQLDQQPVSDTTAMQMGETVTPSTAAQNPTEIALDGNSKMASYIVISKESMTLTLFDANGKAIYRFPVAVGKNYGNKKKSGDMKTPEGQFTVQQIQDASSWTHDFKDGKGVIHGAYGNWFIRLSTPPHKGIGIHGTHAPSSIGTRASEGCIRLRNEDLNKLRPLVKVGMEVRIETSKKDMEADGKQVEGIETTSEPTNSGIELRPATEEQKSAIETTKPADIKPVEDTPKSDIKPDDAGTAAKYAPGEIIEHKVENGQFISHIAVKYNTTSAKILELNEGLVAEKIRPGQIIKVQPNTDGRSSKPAVEKDPSGKYHKIESGDMLLTIAKKYNTTVDEIKALNPGITPENLKIGAEIRVK